MDAALSFDRCRFHGRRPLLRLADEQADQFESRRPGGGQPPVQVDPRRLELGDVFSQSRLEWTIPITNHADHPVHVQRVQGSCTCIAVDPKGFTVPVSATVEVPFALNLLPRKSVGADQTEWAFRESVSAILAPPDGGRITWDLSGNVRRHPVQADPAILRWHTKPIAGMPFSAEMVEVSSRRPIRDLKARCEPAERGSAAVRRPVDESGRWAVVVNLAPDLQVGPVACALVLSAIDGDGAVLPDVVVPMGGEIHREFEASPAVVLLGRHEAGAVITEVVTIRSNCGRSCRCLSVEPGDLGITCSVAPVADLADLHVRLAVPISDTGESSTRISIVLGADEPDEDWEARAPLEIRYVGLAKGERQSFAVRCSSEPECHGSQ